MVWVKHPRPLRDEGLLESALTRPQMAAYYEGADVVRQATLLGTGISQAQAFLDGNKRTAFADAGCLSCGSMAGSIVGDPLELARQFEQFAERSNEPDEAIDVFEAWLRQYVQPRPEARIAVQRGSSTVRTITRISRVATAPAAVSGWR